jgi:transcriptional regulator with XRE-family HTH domain
MPDLKLAERLREARVAAGYAHATDAVNAFGWKKSTYFSNENGHRGIALDTIARYASAFRVPAGWLAYGLGPIRTEITQTPDGKPTMAEASLGLLQHMVQQVLDGQTMLRKDNQNIRRRLARIERTLLSLQRADSDRTEAEGDLQEQIDALTERLDHLEQPRT